MDTRVQTQAARLTGKYFDPLIHLSDPEFKSEAHFRGDIDEPAVEFSSKESRFFSQHLHAGSQLSVTQVLEQTTVACKWCIAIHVGRTSLYTK